MMDGYTGDTLAIVLAKAHLILFQVIMSREEDFRYIVYAIIFSQCLTMTKCLPIIECVLTQRHLSKY